MHVERGQKTTQEKVGPLLLIIKIYTQLLLESYGKVLFSCCVRFLV